MLSLARHLPDSCLNLRTSRLLCVPRELCGCREEAGRAVSAGPLQTACLVSERGTGGVKPANQMFVNQVRLLCRHEQARAQGRWPQKGVQVGAHCARNLNVLA